MRFLTFSFAAIFVLSLAFTGQAALLQDFESGVGTAVAATSGNSPCYANSWATLSTTAGNGGNVLTMSEGGYGNGFVISFGSAVAADGIYKVTCEIQISDANNNCGMNSSYDIENHEPLCYGFGVSNDGSAVVSPSLVSGMYCAWVPNLTTGDDSGLGFQTVELTVPLKAGDLWMWFSTMPNFNTAGTGAWSGDTVFIDNISLTPVADGAIKTVGQGGDYTNFQAAGIDIAGGTLANQYIALWALDATNIVETARAEFLAASATGSVFVCSHPDNTSRPILVGAKTDEAYQIDSYGGSIVKLSDLIFIPPYEADGLIGTGANGNYDWIDIYRRDGAGTVYSELSNCLFTGSKADGSPTDPADALVGGPTQCVYGDDILFAHSNVKATLDNCVLAHVNDDAILTYSDLFIFNNTIVQNTGGLGIQDLCDNTGDGAASGCQHVEVIGWTNSNPVVFDGCATILNEDTYWEYSGSGVNEETTIFRFVEIANTGGASPQDNNDGFYTNRDRAVLLDNCNIHDNGALGVDFHPSSVVLAQHTLTNSTIADNGTSGVQVIRSATCVLDNNTITGNAIHGIALDLYITGVNTVSNCDIADNDGRGIYFDHSTSTLTVTNCDIDNCTNSGMRLRCPTGANISGTTIRNCTPAGVVAAAGGLTLTGCALDTNPIGLSLESSTAGVVAVSGCTFVANDVAINNGGVADNLATATVVNSIFAGGSPCYAFANNNAADAGESITVTYSALATEPADPNKLDGIFAPGAPNRSANDPFDYSDASVINAGPYFLSTTYGDADYLDVDNAAYGGKASGGGDLSGFGAYIGSFSINDWQSY